MQPSLRPRHPAQRLAVRWPSVRLLSTGAAVWLALGANHSAQAQVYVGHAADGSVVISDQRSATTPDVLVEAPPPPPVVPPTASEPLGLDAPGAPASRQAVAYGPVPALPEHYRQLIRTEAKAQRVSPALVAAIAAAESAFNVRALSPKGAAGLMQLMPATARRFKVGNRYSASDSVKGGAAYLRWLSDHFGQNMEKTIAAYNAGEGAVERAGGIPPYAETQAYVPRVLHYLQHFSRLMGDTPS